jgi:hypothetical protein
MTLRETDLVINEGLTISGKVCGNILKSLIIKRQLHTSRFDAKK